MMALSNIPLGDLPSDYLKIHTIKRQIAVGLGGGG
jgi:hypothetical protein